MTAGLRAILECVSAGSVLSQNRISAGWNWEAFLPGDRGLWRITISKYEELPRVLSEARFLVEALRDFGFSPVVTAEGLSLYCYLGDELPEKAHIVIRRQHLDWASILTAPL